MMRAPTMTPSPGHAPIPLGDFSGAHDLLGGISQEARAMLVFSATRRTLAAGTSLIAEQAASESLHLLLDGWAYRYVTTQGGDRQIVLILVPGDFCNLDVLAFGRADYGVRTLTVSTVLSMPRARVAAAGERFPELMRLFLRLSAIENAALARRALCLGRKSARASMAHLLSELAARLGKDRAGASASFELPLTQEQLADALGLTSVHVNRTLQALRADGYLQAQGRRVTIPDIAALRDLAGFEPTYLHRADDATSDASGAPAG